MAAAKKSTITFNTVLQKFASEGEKTGWTYILITEAMAQLLKPQNRKSFRVKGKIDGHKIEGVALIPTGGGSFVLPVNAAMRKAIKSSMGHRLRYCYRKIPTAQN